MQKLMEHLIDLRSQLLSGMLTQQQIRELKINITNKITFGNKMLDLDLIPREQNGEAVDTLKHGVVHIFNSVSFKIRFASLKIPTSFAFIHTHTQIYVKRFFYYST